MPAYKTYAIEREVFANHNTPISMREVQDIADKLFAEFGLPPIPLKRNQRRDSHSSWFWHPTTKYPNGRIAISHHAAAWVVCHEIAHYAAYPNSRGHCRQWKILYVRAVRAVMGDYHADRLRRAFNL